ncbi:hypothetical protein HPB47_023175 [Ixodes persulcatus]|uniref:Uncharacterized protein n=1 Tax=Ixodes persulcatus TaxID=34615 RepID=A0AC60QAW4_IXOPE|nr:hypothetical protein HPB47_023175 [Ixodes persulcatus]
MAEHADQVSSKYVDRGIYYNADETCLFFQLLPSKTIAGKAHQCVSGEDGKNRMTVLLCPNMDGSDKRDAFVLGKSRSPQSFADILSLPM